MNDPIIICGMGHSGTTSVARYLGTSPGWMNYTSGIPEHQKLLECLELLHPEATEGLCVPSRPTTQEGAGDVLLDICKSYPDERLIFKRPWIEGDPDWCVKEFPWAIFLVTLRPFIGCWDSWNKPRSVEGCGLKPDGEIDAGWALWNQQMKGAAKLVSVAERAAFVDHSAFSRCPRYLDEILLQWGVVGDFDPKVVRPI